MEPGQLLTVEWRGKPVWILRRNESMLQNLTEVEGSLRDPNSDELSQQPAYTKNPHRSINPEYMVMIGICTHLGCAPTYRPELGPADLGPEWKGGFFWPGLRRSTGTFQPGGSTTSLYYRKPYPDWY